MNKWFAECVPCKWQETHDTQDAAISAAESHAIDSHRELFSLPGDVRSRKMADDLIAHVQLRDENATTTGVSTGVEVVAESRAETQSDPELDAEEKQLLDRLTAIDRERVKRAGTTKEGA